MKFIIFLCLFMSSNIFADQGVKCLERTTDLVLAAKMKALFYAAMYGENAYLKDCSELNGEDLESLHFLFDFKKENLNSATKAFKETGKIRKGMYENLTSVDANIKQDTMDSKLICHQLDKLLHQVINVGFGSPEKCGKKLREEIISINFNKLSIQESCTRILPLLKKLKETECD